MADAIEIKNLTKSYGGFTLDNISLSLPEGSILGLVGENGAGKSTTIRLIMNAVKRDGGSVSVLGTDNEAPEFNDIKQDIGAVPDEAYFPEVITAKNVGLIMKHTYKKWDDGLFCSYLREFDLPEKKQFKDFSRGMKMKLAIAAALSHKPRLLILDEATSGLDPMVRDEILDIFEGLAREEGCSILLSSHIVSDLEKICDRIAFIHRGKLVFCEEKKRLLEEYAIIALSAEELAVLPDGAAVGTVEEGGGVRTLVRSSLVSRELIREHTSLEDIIVFLAKAEGKGNK